MARATLHDRPGAASRAIAFLLAAGLALVAALAWQAFDAARSQRRTAEAVLRDYARFAARLYLRRARSEVDYYALYPMVYMLSARERQSPGAPLPGPEFFAELQRGTDRAPGLVRHLFRGDLSSGRIDASPETPADLQAWAEKNLPPLLAERVSHGGEIANVSETISGTPRTFVYGAAPDPASPFALAFEVDVRALAPYLEKAFREEPLLPGSLGRSANEIAHLELADSSGREIFRSPGSFEPVSGLSETIADPDAGILRGMSIRASVPRSAAGVLIIGGLPKSRLPLLLLTLSLAVGLLVAALLLSRRERALADLRADFVSGVSHELRTPLAQIRLFAETLVLDRVRSPEERRRSLAIIDQEARRLSHLVENVLQFSRGERGAIALVLEPQELSRLVAEVVDSFAPLAAMRQARVTMDLEPGVAPVDADALRQVLLNLLDNAVRYGPPGQQILVRLTRLPGTARLEVEDEGPGIPMAEREAIWKKFVRLERDRGTHRAGGGIGLAVVRDLVERHGGTAWAEEGARGGARFVVSLPSTGETAAEPPGAHGR
jgi:signal transduction histidine kinase